MRTSGYLKHYQIVAYLVQPIGADNQHGTELLSQVASEGKPRRSTSPCLKLRELLGILSLLQELEVAETF